MARLMINPGAPTAWEVQLRPGINLLGRGFANDFKIEDPSVSSSHCQIIVEQGRVIIRDLGSTNGTFVNRAPVKEALVQSGQSIHLGGVEMIFQDGPPTAGEVGKTEFIRAPIVAKAVPVSPIPGIPAAPKPIVITPVVAAVPQGVPAISVVPRAVQPAAGSPVVAAVVSAPGAPPAAKPFPLPGSPKV